LQMLLPEGHTLLATHSCPKQDMNVHALQAQLQSPRTPCKMQMGDPRPKITRNSKMVRAGP
jgi:hypothetical protein